MPPASEPPVKPLYIALICAAAVLAMFLGSIVISVAVVQSERSTPQTNAQAE